MIRGTTRADVALQDVLSTKIDKEEVMLIFAAAIRSAANAKTVTATGPLAAQIVVATGLDCETAGHRAIAPGLR